MNHSEHIAIDRKLEEERRYKYNRKKLAREESITNVMRFLRPAKAADYRAYLELRCDPCTHFCDYDMPSTQFFVAKVDCEIPPLCGARAINVIAPIGIHVEHFGTETSHCQIYDMDSPDTERNVPSYNDANQG